MCGLIADRVGAKPTLVVGLAVQALAVSLYLVAGTPGASTRWRRCSAVATAG